MWVPFPSAQPEWKKDFLLPCEIPTVIDAISGGHCPMILMDTIETTDSFKFTDIFKHTASVISVPCGLNTQ